MKPIIILFSLLMSSWCGYAQWNTNNMLRVGKNAIYFDDYVSAIDNFNNIIRVKPYLSEPYFFRGLAKLNLDDYEGSIQDFSQAIELNPNYFHAYVYRGIAYQNLKRFEEALKDFEEAVAIDPGQCLCVCEPGNYQSRDGRFAVCRKRLLKGIADRR